MNEGYFPELDNPAWWALTGAQQELVVGNKYVKRYQPGVLPFAAYDHELQEGIVDLVELLKEYETFYFIGKLPALPSHWRVTKELPCIQMTLQSPIT